MADGKAGPPVGNTNATKNRVWSLAIEKALSAKYGRKETLDNLVDLATILLEKCEEKDLPALRELGDRMEGKPAQTIQGPGDDGELPVSLKIIYVDPTSTKA